MRKIILSVVILAGLFGCQKEASEQPDTTPQKGVMVSKEVKREKPDFGADATILYSSADETNLKYFTAPYVTDLYIITGDSPDIQAPAGYRKIPIDLNMGAGGKYIYLCYTKEHDKTPIKYLKLHLGSKFPSPHITSPWQVVRNSNGYGYPGTDLNEGAGGDWIYLYKYPGTIDAITDITVIATHEKYYEVVQRLEKGWYEFAVLGDINKGAGGKYIYILYER